ncbi:flagellar basal body rod protein FlgB [Oceanirhabdus sp. W0125-5]|uniref:flagellar basal body rod protein FlgB n=1 Tax=Oceanirhabdus sp. W0125-5 TaxID=2999116 RepID=UPI0022F31DE5|nr:flagellar basal body rod protein FlgB [Oceanirhabdus sp. W0125-5]WBW95435.1 flagellar basal body rod protein FlgB [Oceanirhabdus sp. W0125-5]
MNITDNNTYSLLKQGLDAASLRGRVISNNIANVNTKGYKKFKVQFEESLNSSSTTFKRTSEKHLSLNGNSTDSGVRVVRDETGEMRTDGNNVDIDNEMTNLAANTLKFNAMVSEMNNLYKMKEMVIKGGA